MEVRDAGQHPTARTMAPTSKNFPVQHVNSADIEKPALAYEMLLFKSFYFSYLFYYVQLANM